MSYFKYLYFVLFFLFQNTVLAECIKGDCVNGQGTFTSEEMLYSGDWKDGKAHGQGFYENKSGLSYKGDWKNSKFDGSGTLTSLKGDEYVGEFKDGKYHGNGVLTYADGIVDEGVWDNGKLIKRIKISKNTQISDLTLFGVSLGDDIWKYNYSQKYFKPNIKNNYCWYSSTEKGLRNGVDYDRCVDLDLFTIGGNSTQSRAEPYKQGLDPYFSLSGVMDGLTFLHSSDHRFFTPQNPNENFDNYLIKFDPSTKKIIGIFAREKKSTSLDNCEMSKFISPNLSDLQSYPYKKWYIDKAQKQGFRILFPEMPGTVKITWEDLFQPIAGFGFTCQKTGTFSYHRWIYLVNFLDSEEYWQNIHSMIDKSLKEKNKKKDKEILESEKFDNM